MKKEWWRGTAQHMWRTYFAICGREPDDGTEKYIFGICDDVLNNRLTWQEQNIVKMFYSPGRKPENYEVENYSLMHDIPTSTIWSVITTANRLVMEQTPLFDSARRNS